MKTAKRVLAILMAMLMAVSMFAVAASAAESLQAKINAAAAGATVGITTNTKESVTISKNLTIDLGGKILKSVNGSPAITVKKGAEVTITNGYVESYYDSYSGWREAIALIDDIGSDSPAAIQASQGSKIILKDVRAMGGLVRIPSTTEYYVPTGSAVKIYGGATVELNQAVLIGSYGVSNDPANTGKADGTVIINDAIIIGYLDYVKRLHPNGVVYNAEKVEKVNAADRIVGYLNRGVTLEESEMRLLKKAFDDRIYIFTQKPTEEYATVEIKKGDSAEGTAIITAETIEHFANTDCSYRYVPKYAFTKDANGNEDATFTLSTETETHECPATLVEGKEVFVKYQLQFQLKGDIKKYANNFAHYLEALYNLAIAKADAAYARVLNAYNTYMTLNENDDILSIPELFKMIDTAQVTIGDQTYSPANIPELADKFYELERALIALGGVTMYNASGVYNKAFTTNMFKTPLYGEGTYAPDEGEYTVDETTAKPTYDSNGHVNGSYYVVTELGVLDTVNNLVEGFKAKKGEGSFADQSKWAGMAMYVAENYGAAFDILDSLQAAVINLQNVLKDSTIQQLVDAAGLTEKVGAVDTLVSYINKAQTYVDKALTHPTVNSWRTRFDNNIDKIPTYVNKAINMYNNWEDYFTPSDFLSADGAFGYAYYLDGPTTENIYQKGLLNLKVEGKGTASYSTNDGINGSTKATLDYVGVNYDASVTLTAAAADGFEFMYWLNGQTDRIISTNPVLTLETKIASYVIAVFESVQLPKMVFTNNSGSVSVTKDIVNNTVNLAAVDAPYMVGYTFGGWGPKGATSSIAVTDATSAYKVGTSAFESGAIYDGNGYAFKLNKTTSNKYLATPKFSSSTTFSLYFVDVDGTRDGNAKVPYGYKTVYTSASTDFSYWMDGEDIVSVYATYYPIAVKDAEYVAVAGAELPDARGVINIRRADDMMGDRASVYVERSIAPGYTVLNTGVICSYTTAFTEPEVDDVDGESVVKSVSTSKTAEGLYVYGVRADLMTEGYAFVRGFAEVKDAAGNISYLYTNVQEY